MSLSTIVRALRQRNALSQTELAERAGVTEKTVVQIEGGIIQQPWPRTVRKLAEALQVTPAVLLGLDPQQMSLPSVIYGTATLEIGGVALEGQATVAQRVSALAARWDKIAALCGPSGDRDLARAEARAAMREGRAIERELASAGSPRGA